MPSFLCAKAGGKLKIFDRAGFDLAISKLGDGEEVELTIDPVDVRQSLKQERGFHAMLAPWAKDGHPIEDLKRDLLAEIFGLREHTDAISGVVVQVLVEPRTSRLGKRKYNELIERTLQIAADCGYVLEAPSEYRERKAREQKRSAA